MLRVRLMLGVLRVLRMLVVLRVLRVLRVLLVWLVLWWIRLRRHGWLAWGSSDGHSGGSLWVIDGRIGHVRVTRRRLLWVRSLRMALRSQVGAGAADVLGRTRSRYALARKRRRAAVDRLEAHAIVEWWRGGWCRLAHVLEVRLVLKVGRHQVVGRGVRVLWVLVDDTIVLIVVVVGILLAHEIFRALVFVWDAIL